MSEAEEKLDPLDEIGEEFLGRFRRGEPLSITDFVARDPAHADEIREFLSALLFIEGLSPRGDGSTGSQARIQPASSTALDRLGDFRIVRELGRGGMGIVYEAVQESLGRRVALKVLAPGLARTPEQLQRFVREARSAARLHHTNIVPVFGVGEHEGVHYYAMQFIPGLGLDKVLDEVRRLRGESTPTRADDPPDLVNDESPTRAGAPGDSPGSTADWHPPAPDSVASAPSNPSVSHAGLAADARSDSLYARGVARIGLQVAEALEYAHQQGTLHRDVKPSNILLDGQGVAWVTDFGLAKATEDEDLTRPGDVVGTVRYMAPERFKGSGDSRADVYGLGLALYELIALRPAFRSAGRDRLFYEVTRVEPPRLRSLCPAVPRDLETIVHKAIEKDAAHRYSSAAAMADDLRRFLENRPIVARRASSTERLSRWARRNPGLATLGTALAGMLALVVTVVALANLRLQREQSDTVFQLRRAEAAEADALARLLDSSIAQARASRRSRFAGRRSDGLRAIAEAARLDTRGERRLELRNEAIACLALTDLQPLPAWLGITSEDVLGLDLDPSSGRMARAEPDGSVLLEGDGASRLPGIGAPAAFLRFSADGRHLAGRVDRDGQSTLVVWNVGSEARLLTIPDGVYAEAIDFHPGGRLLAAGLRDGSIVLHDLTGQAPPRRLQVKTVPRSLRFDPSGDLIAVVSPNSREGVQVRRLADGTVAAAWALTEPEFALDWHPEGRWLAVGAQDGRVRVLDTTDPSRPPRTLEGHDGQIASVAYHPGGTLLATASHDGTLRLWDVRSGLERVRGSLASARSLRFSRDGLRLGPGRHLGDSWLWKVESGTECLSLMGPSGEGPPTWSVDFLAPGLLVSAGEPGLRFETLAGNAPAAFAPLPGTTGLALAPGRDWFVSSGAAGLLRWPVRRPSPAEIRVGPPTPLGPLAGVPTGRVRLDRAGKSLSVVLDDERGLTLLIDPAGTRPPIALAGPRNLGRLDISPDGKWVATGSIDGPGVILWSADTGLEVATMSAKGTAEVVFSPDSHWLAVASATDYTVFRTVTWDEQFRLPRAQAGDLSGVVAFTPDSRHLALARSPGTAELISIQTGLPLASFEAPEPRNIAGIGFSPDGRHMISTFNAHRVQAWNLPALLDGLRPLGLDWPPSPAPARQDASPVRVLVENAPWLGPITEAEALARSSDLEAAASAYDRAIALGAPHLEARTRRVLFLWSKGDAAGYRAACRDLLSSFDPNLAPPRALNEIAWACSLGPNALDDFSPLLPHSEAAAASRPVPNRLNTYGALLYRAGQFEAAIRQLERSVEVHGAGGTPYDALFLAMAHHRLGHVAEAASWFARDPFLAPISMQKPDARGDTSWIPRLELRLLRLEAASLLHPPAH